MTAGLRAFILPARDEDDYIPKTFLRLELCHEGFVVDFALKVSMPMLNSAVIIPARYDSKRIPGKMLLDRTGKPLIQHVYEAAQNARKPSRIIVATDDKRIMDTVTGFGGTCVMTRADHESGSDRVAEAAAMIDCDIVLNLQGDEPLMEGEVIDCVIGALEKDPSSQVSTAAVPFASSEEVLSPSAVKVVTDNRGYALYFSRSPIPCIRDGDAAPVDVSRLHLGIYAFRRDFLIQFTRMPPSPLEQLEKLEQLRILENGYRIKVVSTQSNSFGIDTLADYKRFARVLKESSL